MPQMQFGLSSYQRARGDLPALPVINMFAEESPTEEKGIILQSRPGLEDRAADMGDGPVQRLFKRDGVLDGGLFGVSGGVLYAGASPVGGISGSLPVSMAGYENLLFIAAGGALYGYNGASLSEIAFPDNAAVSKVVILGGRAVLIRADTERFYWTDPLTDTIDSLSFATAENQPDRLRDMLAIDDILVLFGAETIEFWPNTQDADLPFAPLEGRVFEVGIRATGCATTWGSTFAWVGSDHVVYMNGQEPTPISEPGLQAKIEASSDCALSTFHLDGQEFLCLRLDDETQVFGNRNRRWSEMESWGFDNWRVTAYDGGVFGCVDGKTAVWSSGHTDFGGVLERRFRAGFPLNSGGVTIDNVILRANVGQTPYLVGDYADPVVEMRVSRDVGQTWGAWKPRPLGEQGRYRKKIPWRACGMASAPGHLAEFRCVDPVPFRASDVLINEPGGGR